MEYGTITSLIIDVGLPIGIIAILLCSAIAGIKKVYEDFIIREKNNIESLNEYSKSLSKVADTIAESDRVNKELSETNRLLVEKLVDKVSDLEVGINKVIDKLEKTE